MDVLNSFHTEKLWPLRCGLSDERVRVSRVRRVRVRVRVRPLQCGIPEVRQATK